MARNLVIQRVHDKSYPGYRINEDYVEYRVWVDGKKVLTTGDYRSEGQRYVQGFAECFKYLNSDHSVVWETVEEEDLV